jgi:hypothetical protein
MRTKAICWKRIFPSQEGSLIKFLEPDQSDKTEMSASDGTSIYQNDPLQKFGDRQPQTSYTISYIRISIRQTMEKTLKSEKRGSPLYPVMWECAGYIPAKLGRDEKLLNKKSGKPSQN